MLQGTQEGTDSGALAGPATGPTTTSGSKPVQYELNDVAAETKTQAVERFRRESNVLADQMALLGFAESQLSSTSAGGGEGDPMSE